MSTVLHVILSSYLRYPARMALLMLSLIAAGAGLSAVLVLNETAKQSYQSMSRPMLQGVTARLVGSAEKPISKTDYARLRRQGFSQQVAVVTSVLEIEELNTKEKRFVPVYGIDTVAILSLVSDQSITTQNDVPQAMDLLSQSGAALIHRKFANAIGLKDGQKISGDSGSLFPPISVIDANLLSNEIVTDISHLQAFTGDTDINEIWLVDMSVEDIEQLSDILPQHMNVEWLPDQDSAEQLTDSFHLNLLALSLLMFVVCLFIVTNAYQLLLVKRLPTLTILRQLGTTRQSLILVLLTELIVVCLLMAPVSVWLGINAAAVLSPEVVQTLRSLYGLHLTYQEASVLKLFLITFFALFAGSVIAVYWPITRLRRNLDYRKTPSDNSLHVQLLVPIFLAVSGYFCLSAGYGLVVSFSGIAALIIASCLLVIMILPVLLRLAKAAVNDENVQWRWQLAESIRISRQSKVALCAFYIAVTCNLGMDTMVGSFRVATYDWVSTRLDADGYLYINNTQQQEALHTLTVSGIEITPRYKATIGIEQWPDVEVYSYPSGPRHESSMVFEQALPEAWQLFNQHKGILINQQLSIKGDLSIGDEVSVSLAKDDSTRMIIAGIYLDYGDPQVEVMLPDDLVEPIGRSTNIYAVWADNEASYTQFSERLSSRPKYPELLDQNELVDESMKAFDTTFGVTDALNLVTLFVAAFSLAASLVILDKDNRPQQALARSLGISRYRLMGMSLLQYLIVCCGLCLLAWPAGIGLSWALINIVNVEAFAWHYPLIISLTAALNVLFLSVGVVLLSLAGPVIRQFNQPLLEDLRWLS